MAQRRFHYDRAFEHYLCAKAIPYVAVDEAKRALSRRRSADDPGSGGLKNFDFVAYSQSGPNLLVDVKGRKHSGVTGRSFQNWVTADDVDSLAAWQDLFGEGFQAAFAFLFWCEAQPPDALFHEVFTHQGRWYAVLAAPLEAYRAAMRPRSERWGTVSVPARAFDEISQPLDRMLLGDATGAPDRADGLFGNAAASPRSPQR